MKIRAPFILFFFFSFSVLSAAPPPPPGGTPSCWPPPCIPVDGGISLLIGAAVIYGGSKLRKSGSKNLKI